MQKGLGQSGFVVLKDQGGIALGQSVYSHGLGAAPQKPKI